MTQEIDDIVSDSELEVHPYSDNETFDGAVSVGHSNRIVSPNVELMAGEFDLGSLIQQYQGIEENLETILIGRLSTLQIRYESSSMIIFENMSYNQSIKTSSENPRFFSISIYESKEDKTNYKERAIKSFAKLCQVPFHLVQKTDPSINSDLFSFHQRRVANDNLDPSVIVVFNDNDKLIELDSAIINHWKSRPGEDSTQAPIGSIFSYEITFMYAKSATKDRKPGQIMDFVNHTEDNLGTHLSGLPITQKPGSRLLEDIPIFSNIIHSTELALKAIDRDMKIISQMSSSGYTNSSTHFNRFLLKGEKYKFLYKDLGFARYDHNDEQNRLDQEKYSICLNVSVESDNPKGKITFGLGIYREICENGMISQVLPNQLTSFRENYIGNKIAEFSEIRKQNPVLCEVTSYEEDGTIPNLDQPEIDSLHIRFGEAFDKLFGDGVYEIPFQRLNRGQGLETLTQYLRTMIDTAQLSFKENLSYFQDMKLVSFDPRTFVKEVDVASKLMKFSSPQLIKYFLMEYISCIESGDNSSFKTLYDMVNYITFMAKSLKAKSFVKVESEVFELAHKVHDLLVNDSSKGSLYEDLRNQIGTIADLRRTEAEMAAIDQTQQVAS